jgi:hypothetical protein
LTAFTLTLLFLSIASLNRSLLSEGYARGCDAFGRVYHDIGHRGVYGLYAHVHSIFDVDVGYVSGSVDEERVRGWMGEGRIRIEK